MSLEFTTAKRRTDPIPFKIDGVEYSFNPPKRAVMVLPLLDGADMADVQYNWLSKGLGEEQWARIVARLEDEADDFDTPDIHRLVQDLLDEMSGRPTG